MSAMSGLARVRVCGVDEVAPGSVRRFEPEGSPALAVVRCDDGWHAVVDSCSHEDYPLSEGEVFADICEIECVRHGSTFSLADGEPQTLPATRPVKILPVEIIGSEVWVGLP